MKINSFILPTFPITYFFYWHGEETSDNSTVALLDRFLQAIIIN